MSETEGTQISDSCKMRELALGQRKEWYAWASGVAGLPIKAARPLLRWYEKDRALLPCVILASAATIAYLENGPKI
jgi:hypothetical protein